MLSNTKCKQILNKNGVYYTDKEIVLIKQILYKLAEIMFYKTLALKYQVILLKLGFNIVHKI